MRRGMPKGAVELPESFSSLGPEYCSLGQGQNYYETFATLETELSETILVALRDCVFDPTIFDEFFNEPAMQTSLLRSVDARSVRETFRAALLGNAFLTPFNFGYQFPDSDLFDDQSPFLTFSVQPHSMPPTNIHAIIGRNGVGKTRLLWNIANVLCRPKEERSTDTQFGEIFLNSESDPNEKAFSKLVTVAFSAFDPFRAPKEGAVTTGDIHYSYLGLRKRVEAVEDDGEVREQRIDIKSEEDLLAEFLDSLSNCVHQPRLRRWRTAINLLESDPGFRDLELSSLATDDAEARLSEGEALFKSLSSGHKIVLLTVTRLVELIDERTLVLIDEPESHLHPPLLSSLVRVLSVLLMLRNGAAILATHSPVVLQEMPKSCVWMLRRSGDVLTAERPSTETFGENVGVLTREVFGLEVTDSGFHKLIVAALDETGQNFETVVGRFNQQLGSEARAIALAVSRSRK
jgi:predicted ATPase